MIDGSKKYGSIVEALETTLKQIKSTFYLPEAVRASNLSSGLSTYTLLLYTVL